MAAKSSKKAKQIANIKLTEEQRGVIEQATGVAVKELSIIEFTGENARELNATLLKASSVVMCW